MSADWTDTTYVVPCDVTSCRAEYKLTTTGPTLRCANRSNSGCGLAAIAEHAARADAALRGATDCGRYGTHTRAGFGGAS